MSFNRRSPLVVLYNVKKLTQQNASNNDLETYMRGEGYSPQELDRVPIPRNLDTVAHLVKFGSILGHSLENSPGILGEMARNPNFMQFASKDTMQILGEVGGAIPGAAAGAYLGKTPQAAIVGAQIGSKIGGTFGATSGEALSQAIQLVRGDQVSPEAAMREVIHTGQITLASEMAFGSGSPGEKLLGKSFNILGNWWNKATPAMKNVLAEVLSKTAPQITKEDILDLFRRGASKILTKFNLGTSIDPSIVNKATEALTYMRKSAQVAWNKIAEPFLRDKGLKISTASIVDDYVKILQKYGYLGEDMKRVTGKFSDVTQGEFEDLMQKKIQLETRNVGTQAKPFIVGSKEATFNELWHTRREIYDTLHFQKGTQAVAPKSDRYSAVLSELADRISARLHAVGGAAFQQADQHFSEAMKLFGDLYPTLKTPLKAERTLETVIKQARQSQTLMFEKLNDLVPKNLQFFQDIDNFQLAQKFKSEAVSWFRAGILGSIIGAPGMIHAITAANPALGGIATATGIATAYATTTSKGVGRTLKLLQNLVATAKRVAPNILKSAQRTAPILTRRTAESVFPQ